MDKNDEMNQIKVFTVEEVNGLLPKLTALIRQLQDMRDLLARQEVEIDSVELITEKNKKGESPVLDPKVDRYNQTIASFYDMIDQIQGYGCFLKDVDLGLVDFYTVYEGRMVYLCWKQGEKEVRYWHDVESGYGHRQPLNPGDPPAP